MFGVPHIMSAEARSELSATVSFGKVLPSSKACAVPDEDALAVAAAVVLAADGVDPPEDAVAVDPLVDVVGVDPPVVDPVVAVDVEAAAGVGVELLPPQAARNAATAVAENPTAVKRRTKSRRLYSPVISLCIASETSRDEGTAFTSPHQWQLQPTVAPIC